MPPTVAEPQRGERVGDLDAGETKTQRLGEELPVEVNGNIGTDHLDGAQFDPCRLIGARRFAEQGETPIGDLQPDGMMLGIVIGHPGDSPNHVFLLGSELDLDGRFNVAKIRHHGPPLWILSFQ